MQTKGKQNMYNSYYEINSRKVRSILDIYQRERTMQQSVWEVNQIFTYKKSSNLKFPFKNENENT